MNNKVIGIIAFAAGAAIGSVATWKVVKTKYEQIAQEEIESVREIYFHKDEDEPVEDFEEGPKMAEIRSYRDTVEGAGYTNYCGNSLADSEVEAMVKEKAKAIVDECNNIIDGSKKEDMKDKPYVISPDEFDTNGYDIVTLVCYSDKVVTTYNTGDAISNEEVDKLVGLDSLSHFGEYEEDSVYVRNDERKIDYEILRDEDPYYD